MQKWQLVSQLQLRFDFTSSYLNAGIHIWIPFPDMGEILTSLSFPETTDSHFYLVLGSVIQSFKWSHIISWCPGRSTFYPHVCYHIHTSVSVPEELEEMQRSFQTLHWTSTTRMASYLEFPSTDTELFIAVPSSLFAASSCCHWRNLMTDQRSKN